MLVPRVCLRLPAGVRWQRIPYATASNARDGVLRHQRPGVLWAWDIDEPEVIPFKLATAAEESRFRALTQKACYVLAYEHSLDVRAWPHDGNYDPDRRVGHGGFELATLFELIERSADFAQSASSSALS